MNIHYQSIEEIGPKELEIFVNLEKDIFSGTSFLIGTVEEAKVFLKDAVILFIYDDAKPIGCVAYTCEEKEAEILTMALLKEYRGLGVGGGAFQRVLDLLKEFKKVRLVVDPKNSRAICFYLKHGFEITKWAKDHYGPGVDRLVLCREEI